MTLVDRYLKAVAVYLRGAPQRDDLVAELAEHLHAKMEEREAAQGRALTEQEQVSVLAGHGNPLAVAARYGITTRGLDFGRQLIGPALFPLYARTLALVFGLTLLVPVVSLWADEPPLSHPLRVVLPMLVQFVVITLVFVAIEALQHRLPTPGSRDGWLFPPAHLRPVPRWQSASGLIVLGLLGVWWLLLPSAPALLLGPAAGRIELSPSWGPFYWPVTGLLLAGLAHRAVNLARPDSNWLQPAARLTINLACLGMVYPFLQSDPLVVAPDAHRVTAETIRLAQRVDNRLWWIACLGLPAYWLVNVAVFGTICAQHVRYRMRRQRDPLS
jgi:hypothetical protein